MASWRRCWYLAFINSWKNKERMVHFLKKFWWRFDFIAVNDWAGSLLYLGIWNTIIFVVCLIFRILMLVLTIIDGNAKASFTRLDIEFQYQKRRKVQHRKKSLAKKIKMNLCIKLPSSELALKIFLSLDYNLYLTRK